jgi:hypothetical protein
LPVAASTWQQRSQVHMRSPSTQTSAHGSQPRAAFVAVRLSRLLKQPHPIVASTVLCLQRCNMIRNISTNLRCQPVRSGLQKGVLLDRMLVYVTRACVGTNDISAKFGSHIKHWNPKSCRTPPCPSTRRLRRVLGNEHRAWGFVWEPVDDCFDDCL